MNLALKWHERADVYCRSRKERNTPWREGHNHPFAARPFNSSKSELNLLFFHSFYQTPCGPPLSLLLFPSSPLHISIPLRTQKRIPNPKFVVNICPLSFFFIAIHLGVCKEWPNFNFTASQLSVKPNIIISHSCLIL